MCADSSVFVVVPAHNEAPVLRSTLESVLSLGYSVVVVDDGSTDNTGEVALALPVHYLRHPVNLGQGAAIQTGTEYALRQGARVIVHFDADGQHPADRIPDFVQAIRIWGYDVVLGSRFLDPQHTRMLPRSKRILLRCAVAVTWAFTGVWLTDAHNGFRALTLEAARRIRLSENGFAHATELIEQLRVHRLRYLEMPSAIRYTEYSIRKGQRLSGSFTILADLLLRKVMK